MFVLRNEQGSDRSERTSVIHSSETRVSSQCATRKLSTMQKSKSIQNDLNSSEM